MSYQSIITKLAVSSNNLYLAAVVGEDKSIHILTAQTLQHLSKRHLPKRPCCLSFTPNNDHILCGDKFGDVYALPTLDDDVAASVEATKPGSNVQANRQSGPAATELTVHTERNRKALANQLKMASTSSQNKQREEPLYEPILGHVSMLTDLISVKVSQGGQTKREYIITSDRDEHIRVSRGLPQAHVIENHCLGHKQFVNRLCLPRDDILVSGGGDDYICAWDWVNGQLLGRFDVKTRVKTSATETLHEYMGEKPITVSGLWSLKGFGNNIAKGCIECLVALEGVPLLLHYRLVTDFETRQWDNDCHDIYLPSNVLDVVVLSDKCLVSLDNTSQVEPALRADQQMGKSAQQRRMFTLYRTPEGFVSRDREYKDMTDPKNLSHTERQMQSLLDNQLGPDIQDTDVLSELLYGAGRLRKRGDEDT